MTVVAGARRRAANQLVDVAGKDAAGDEHPHPALGADRTETAELAADREVADQDDHAEAHPRRPEELRRDPAEQSLGERRSRSTTARWRRRSSSRRRPSPCPVGGAMRAWPARSVPRAATWMSPSRSPRSGTAIRATQMNIVFWMKAAVGAVAIARPLKKRTNGMLPPMIAIATRPSRFRLSRARTSRPAPKRQREPDQDDRRDAVLGGRVDRGVRDGLDAERVEVDRETADRGRPEGEEHASPRGQSMWHCSRSANHDQLPSSLAAIRWRDASQRGFGPSCLIEHGPDLGGFLGVEDAQHGSG